MKINLYGGYALIVMLFVSVYALFTFGFGAPRHHDQVSAAELALDSDEDCPNVLLRRGSQLLLINTRQPTVDGVNPIHLESLDDYVAYAKQQNLINKKKCPILFLQQENSVGAFTKLPSPDLHPPHEKLHHEANKENHNDEPSAPEDLDESDLFNLINIASSTPPPKPASPPPPPPKPASLPRPPPPSSAMPPPQMQPMPPPPQMQQQPSMPTVMPPPPPQMQQQPVPMMPMNYNPPPQSGQVPFPFPPTVRPYLPPPTTSNPTTSLAENLAKMKPATYVDASRDDSPFNQNMYTGFDPINLFAGVYTEVDKTHYSTQLGTQLSDNAMDPNWGGVQYTKRQIDTGKYDDNMVESAQYSVAPNTFMIPSLRPLVDSAAGLAPLAK